MGPQPWHTVQKHTIQLKPKKVTNLRKGQGRGKAKKPGKGQGRGKANKPGKGQGRGKAKKPGKGGTW